MRPSHLYLKVRHVFVPLVGLTLGFCVVYSTLDWLFVVRGNLLPLGDDVAGYWLPFVLAFLLVILTMRRAFRILKSPKRGRAPYYLVAGAFVAVPTIIAQALIRSATGDLSHVESLAQISGVAAAKYYAVDHVCLDRSRAWTQPEARTYKGNLNFYVYAVVPLCRSDRTQSSDSIWIGYQLHKRVDTSLSPAEKDAAYRELWGEWLTTLNDRDPSAYPFFERLGRPPYRKDFAALLSRAGIDLEAPSTVLLIPHTERFSDRTGHQLQWMLASFGIGAALWLGIVLLVPLSPSKDRKWLTGEDEEDSERTRARALAFIRGAYGLEVLVAVNVLVYMAMVFSGLGVASFDSDDLLKWGANYRPALHGAGYVRLLTSEFVHGGLLHLVNNIYGLVVAGIFLLPITGNAGLIACYLLAGLGGSIASAYIHPATVSVGASGAIFGLFAMLLVHLAMGDKKLLPVRARLLPGIAIFVAFNLLIGAASQGIDNSAHVGGLLTGVALGLVFFMPIRQARRP
ncbi:MAG TPA: rhomboid family intramembrane serine protease [Steroidobacteraceae bacterium]|nr:rhomboid family intramembrane serine protease [Steroidobacteraceae bacterium]